MEHVFVVVFMLEQTYLATNAVITYSIVVSGQKLTVFERSSPEFHDFGVEIWHFFTPIGDINYMEHIFVVVFMLEQTYLANNAVITCSIVASGKK